MNCVPLLLIGALASAQPGPKRVAVFDLTRSDVKPAVARKADAVLRSLVKKWEGGSEILAPGPAADCAIVDCFVSMAKEMAATEVVAGRLSSLGKTLVLELQRIDVERDRAVATTVRTVKNDEDALFGAINDSLEELFRAEIPAGAPSRAAKSPRGAAPVPAASTSASPEPVQTGETRTMLVTGFEDLAPGTHVDSDADSASRITARIVTNPVHTGTRALLVEAETQYWTSTLIPLSGKAADWTGMTTLKFWIHGTGSGNRFDLQLEDADRELFIQNLTDDSAEWKQVVLPLADIRPRTDFQSPVSRLNGKIDYPIRNIQITTLEKRGGQGSRKLGFDDFEVTR